MTILRKAEHEALSRIALSGRVLDLGGDRRSEYQKLFKGTYSIVTANANKDSEPDILCDLERPLPIETGSYDGVLLINVLEHIFEYRKLLAECARVIAKDGTLVVVVPFIFPYHASPHDFHRYTAEALERALTLSGFSRIEIRALGSGVFAARWVLVERLLPALQVCAPLVALADGMFSALARLFKKKYAPGDYALGYVATARKMR